MFLIVLIIPSRKCDSRNVSTRLTSVRAYPKYPVEAQRRCVRTSMIRFHPLYRENFSDSLLVAFSSRSQLCLGRDYVWVLIGTTLTIRQSKRPAGLYL